MKKFSTYLQEPEFDIQLFYEQIGYACLDDELIKEGISDSIVKLVDKAKEKAEGIKKSGKQFISKMSDSSKKAIEKVKKTAGESWEKIKDFYTSLVAIIDNALIHSVKIINSMSNLLDITAVELEQSLAIAYLTILAAVDNDAVSKVADFIIHMPKTTQQMLILNLFIIIVPLVSSHCGIDTSGIIDVIKVFKHIKGGIKSLTNDTGANAALNDLLD